MMEEKERKITYETTNAKVEELLVSDFIKDDFKNKVIDKFKDMGEVHFEAIMMRLYKKEEDEKEKKPEYFVLTHSEKEEADKKILWVATTSTETFDKLIELIKEV